jgi:hypothetical protein
MKIAKLNPDLSVHSVSNAKWVKINEGADNESRQPPSIFKSWTDDELNAIGYARFDDTPVPNSKRISATQDTLIDGRIKRTYTLIDYVAPPPPPDKTPLTVLEAAWTEDIPAVMSKDGLTEVTPASTVEHPAVTEPNLEYDYGSERQRVYPHIDEMIVALWEQVVESRPEAATAVEVERQATKARFPKPDPVV